MRAQGEPPTLVRRGRRTSASLSVRTVSAGQERPKPPRALISDFSPQDSEECLLLKPQAVASAVMAVREDPDTIPAAARPGKVLACPTVTACLRLASGT